MTKPRRFLESLIKPWLHRDEREAKEEDDLEAIAAKEQKAFKYEILAAATRNFDPKLKLGEGGFGPVFKGRLEDGREVAVKRLGRRSWQGEKEFTNEAMLLSRVQHKNVVNLYGYCSRADDKLLVYEYVPNESLDKLLFSPGGGGGGGGEDPEVGRRRAELLDWNRRYEVILGVARGLLYLHEDAHTPIIHRDIKASNILLDGRWTPKIADFGMARLYPESLTHVHTRVAGTDGYMAPEYAMHGSLSAKADVFSFGVLVLELISGQRNSSCIPIPGAQSLLEWAWKLHKKGKSLEIMDPALRSTAVPEQVATCVHIGLLCTQSDPKVRPAMKRVVMILSKKPSTLEEPIRPGILGFRYRRRAYGSQGSSHFSSEYSKSSTGTTSASISAPTSTANSTMNTPPTTTTSAGSLTPL